MNNIGCYEGDVRLVDGATGLEGRLEICRNNVWGTVCHNRWDHNDARVVCQQLGLSAVGKDLKLCHTCAVSQLTPN